MDIIKYYVEQFNINDEEFIKNDIDNEKSYEWMKKEIPLFTCSDKDIERAYYFRWWTYRKHIKSTDDGVIITEFLPGVPWSGEHNAIIAPVGHHLCEGRWLRSSEKYLKSYIKFFLQKCTHSFDYSTWFISAIYEYSAITDDFDFGDDFIDLLEEHYRHWEETHRIADGSFWSIDGYDAMEFSVSGTDKKLQTMRGIRPTLNSYMCANALALSKFAAVYGDTDRAEKYLKKHEFLKNFINENLFEDGFFRAYHYYGDEDPTKAKDKKQVFPKELIGFIPFMFDIPEKGREECFDLLLDDKCFYNEYGLTSLEKTNERFLYEVDHECLWNGYIWPFATAQTLTALIKVAKGSDSKKYSDMFVTLLSQYAKMHKRVTEEGKTIDWIDEVMSPVDGSWSSREVLKNRGWREGKGGYERGKDYNHSTFCDLVISGLAGVGVRDGKLTVNPVLSDDIEYFTLNNLKVLGKEYEISYTKENGITVIEH